MVVRVAIKPVLLEWAIKRSGRSMSEIEHKFPKVQQWLAESYQPSLKQLEDFAAFTYTPFGYFFLQAPPKEMLPIPLYRTLDSYQEPNEASVNLMDTIQTMQSRQSWLRDYLIERGADPLSFVRSANIHDNVAEVARHIRKTLKLTTDWAANIPQIPVVGYTCGNWIFPGLTLSLLNGGKKFIIGVISIPMGLPYWIKSEASCRKHVRCSWRKASCFSTVLSGAWKINLFWDN